VMVTGAVCENEIYNENSRFDSSGGCRGPVDCGWSLLPVLSLLSI
jgi:hypothetical protein